MGQRTLQEFAKGQFVQPIEDVLSLCPPTSFLPLQSLPALWFNPSQGQWMQNSQSPGSLPGEISHIPQSVFHRKLWYLITRKKFGIILKLKKKSMNESPWTDSGEDPAFPTGSFVLLEKLEERCCGEQLVERSC